MRDHSMQSEIVVVKIVTSVSSVHVMSLFDRNRTVKTAVLCIIIIIDMALATSRHTLALPLHISHQQLITGHPYW